MPGMKPGLGLARKGTEGNLLNPTSWAKNPS